MNETKILSLALDLKDEIINSALYKNLKNIEQEMFKDNVCSSLLYSFEKAKNDYFEAKRFEKYGSDLKNAQILLSDIKTKINNNKIVINYNNALNEFNLLLKEIESTIFKGLLN